MAKNGTVVIIGRMNVGKSTLFNRLAENTKSIAFDYQGVTRDFIKDTVCWKDYTFNLIDSGGISLRKSQDTLLNQVQESIKDLIKRADVILFMVDGMAGVLPEDKDISKLLHKSGKPVVLAINKADTKQTQENLYQFEKLGHNKIVLISAIHGTGINDLLDDLIEYLPKQTVSEEEKPSYKVVFLGKPNVGKSSLSNALLQEERSIVSDIPGTTRESISERINFYKESIKLTDTPGIRRKRAISEDLESLMVKNAMRSLKNSDIVVLMIDGSNSVLVDQELKLAFYAFNDQYKALLLVVNKTDIMTEEDRESLERDFKSYPNLIKRIQTLFISVKSNKNVGKVLPAIQKLWQRHSQKLDDAALTRLFISELVRKPMHHKGEHLKVYKVEQTEVAPITIKLYANKPSRFGQSQIKFFENLLRSNYDLQGVPVKFIVRR